jgi:TRAP-type C4-dicarboxylate transport system permease large subunit
LRRFRIDDAVHHRRRHPGRLVHGDGIGRCGRDLRGGAIARRIARWEWRSRPRCSRPASSAIALFCVGTASIFGWLLAYYQIPKALLSNVTTWGMGPIGVGFFIVFVFLVVGCFLDAIPAIIIVGTVLQPLAASVGMHPVSFAIISIVALAFGLVTPPYGMCLMVSCAIAKVRLRYALKDTMIMLVPMLLVLFAMIIFPQIPLFLPELIRPEFLK